MWEPDRNPEDKKDFITFIAHVEGLSAVPDGRIYMNAFIDAIKGERNVEGVEGAYFHGEGNKPTVTHRSND